MIDGVDGRRIVNSLSCHRFLVSPHTARTRQGKQLEVIDRDIHYDASVHYVYLTVCSLMTLYYLHSTVKRIHQVAQKRKVKK